MFIWTDPVLIENLAIRFSPGVYTYALTNSSEDVFGCHLANAIIEGCRRLRVADSTAARGSSPIGREGSSWNWLRHSGWRLKFPGTFVTVPDIGNSHWSQIISMLFTSLLSANFGACRLLITSRATLDVSCRILEPATIRTKAIREDNWVGVTGQSERSIWW